MALRLATFASLKESWLDDFRAAQHSHTKASGARNGVLLGLQSDLEEFAAVNGVEAIKLAKEHNLAAMLCSAKLARDVDTPFNFVAQQCYLKHIRNATASKK